MTDAGILARLLLASSLAGLAACQAACAQSDGAAPLLATRLVAQFAEKEAALADAVAKGNRPGARSLVTEDFEVVAASDLGESASLNSLLEDAARHPNRRLSLRELSARDLGQVVLVNFYWDETGASAKRTWVVTDAWMSRPEGWRLKIRFIGPKGNSKDLPPGFRPSEPVIKKKY